MELVVIAVGRLKPGPERELVGRYLSRSQGLGRTLGLAPVSIVEIPEGRGRREADRRAEEGAAIAQRLRPGGIVFALDERGRSPSSESLAERMVTWRDGGRSALQALIGGPDGLDPALRDRADLVLSFGALTLPHQLVRVLLVEQIYRALTIIAGHPYHRAGDRSSA